MAPEKILTTSCPTPKVIWFSQIPMRHNWMKWYFDNQTKCRTELEPESSARMYFLQRTRLMWHFQQSYLIFVWFALVSFCQNLILFRLSQRKKKPELLPKAINLNVKGTLPEMIGNACWQLGNETLLSPATLQLLLIDSKLSIMMIGVVDQKFGSHVENNYSLKSFTTTRKVHETT